MNLQRTVIGIAIVLTVVSAGTRFVSSVSAQEAPDPAQRIRERVRSYVAAFNAGDAEQLAGHWSESGVQIDRTTGERISGRDAIRAHFKSMSAADGPMPELSVDVESIRLVTTEVAIEEGTATVVFEDREPSVSSYTAVHILQDGEWYIDSVRETVVPMPPPAPSGYRHLQDLEWMIGEWVDQDDDATVHTICEWTANRNFITRSFSVSIGDHVNLAGTQVVGWDPVDRTIRSWVFDSDGGFGQGVWSRKGDQWTIKAVGTLPDGRMASAVRVIRLVDDNTFTLRVTNRTVAGEIQPSVDEVRVVRVTDDD